MSILASFTMELIDVIMNAGWAAYRIAEHLSDVVYDSDRIKDSLDELACCSTLGAHWTWKPDEVAVRVPVQLSEAEVKTVNDRKKVYDPCFDYYWRPSVRFPQNATWTVTKDYFEVVFK